MTATEGPSSPQSPGRFDTTGSNNTPLEPPPPSMTAQSLRTGMMGEAGMGMTVHSGMEYGGGMGDMGGEGKQNMGLRLDMNYMSRPSHYYGSGQLNSSHSHSRTHSTHSTQSFQLPSASVSPVSSMSHHIYNARSPDLILPKVSLLSL